MVLLLTFPFVLNRLVLVMNYIPYDSISKVKESTVKFCYFKVSKAHVLTSFGSIKVNSSEIRGISLDLEGAELNLAQN